MEWYLPSCFPLFVREGEKCEPQTVVMGFACIAPNTRTELDFRDAAVNTRDTSPRALIRAIQEAVLSKKGLRCTAVVDGIGTTRALKPVISARGEVDHRKRPSLKDLGIVGTNLGLIEIQ